MQSRAPTMGIVSLPLRIPVLFGGNVPLETTTLHPATPRQFRRFQTIPLNAISLSASTCHAFAAGLPR